MTKPVPMYRLDEHHEAYLAWWDCRRNSLGVPHHLIHIDEHADFGIPSLTGALPCGPQATLSAVAALTYHQLTIGTFLVPAYLAGFFDRLSWLKPRVARTRLKESIGFDNIETPPFIKKSILKFNMLFVGFIFNHSILHHNFQISKQ